MAIRVQELGYTPVRTTHALTLIVPLDSYRYPLLEPYPIHTSLPGTGINRVLGVMVYIYRARTYSV